MPDPSSTDEMGNALPNEDKNESAQNGIDGNWVAPQAYDYTAMANPPENQTWDGDAKVYAWDDEFGDVGPKFPELELELFGDPSSRHEHTGVDFSL